MKKISIKREQSQAGLSFAERENRRSLAGGESKFRPQVKNKLFLLLALLLTAATGAWAQSAAWTLTAYGDLQTGDSVVIVDKTSERAMSNDKGTSNPPSAVEVTLSSDKNSLSDAPADNLKWVVERDGDNYKFRKAGSDAHYLYNTSSNNGVRVGTINANQYVFENGGENDVPFMKNTSNSRYIGVVDNSDWRCYTSINSNIKNTVTALYTKPAASSGGGSGEGSAEGATYTVSLKDNVKDADKWTVKVGEGQAQALPIGGLKGDGSETVTLQYTGRLKVKGVKATSDAAAAEASVPDGALSGKFSVSDGKQVYFSKGNLRYESSKWSFFDNQYDYYTSYSADAWDHFGWSTSATDYGMNTSAANSDYSGDFVDWGATMGTGWFTLSSDEWTYLFNTRSASTVNGTENGRYAKAKVNNVGGIILFPDTYTHPDGVTAPTGVNETGNTGWNGNSYTAEDWTKMESAGCVFLPAAGYRNGSRVNNPGSFGDYSSATPYGTDKTYGVFFGSGNLTPASEGSRFYGLSVRLVSEVTTSEAAEPAKEPATVTTAPTGAAIVGVGKTTALVSGGAAEGGTLMYKVTTENTKPTSTDGFSDAVPTAEGISASGTVYVWYYVKGDDTHSDSEIAATAIVVPVADIVWDATNATDIYVSGTSISYEKEGVTLSGNANQIDAQWADNEDPTKAGIRFQANTSGGFTFTAPDGKAFTKIEMKALGEGGWSNANLGTGWAFNNPTVTWTGSAASTVGLLTGANKFKNGEKISYIAFTLVDAE